MNSPDKPWVVIAAGATIETSLLPYHLVHLMSHLNIAVSCAVSANAKNFVTETALKGITGMPVYNDEQLFDPISGQPLHLRYSESNLLVIYPASARIIAQCALGEVTCPVTRLFAFSLKENVIICPALHPRMDIRLYLGHLNTLQKFGCTILGNVGESTNSESIWPQVEREIADRLGISPSISPPQVYKISHRDKTSG
jgi:Flavoprotein